MEVAEARRMVQDIIAFRKSPGDCSKRTVWSRLSSGPAKDTTEGLPEGLGLTGVQLGSTYRECFPGREARHAIEADLQARLQASGEKMAVTPCRPVVLRSWTPLSGGDIARVELNIMPGKLDISPSGRQRGHWRDQCLSPLAARTSHLILLLLLPIRPQAT
ncbi:hypothetical protein PoB_007079600 [Plakobranchus ocellatus]|uniref:Uncharacterized protein n=1 Tax=Plakobranchus ocellatus TaxID=259542 RepID=A0AAV4DK07_9GAST|nr:hypothetical protein PoB_007079600 [Plakobranchus ocellatus]